MIITQFYFLLILYRRLLDINLLNKESSFIHSGWVLLGFILFFLYVYWYGYKKVSRINKNLIKTFSELDNTNEQYSLYFLYFGISIPIIEFLVEFSGLRKRDTFMFNIVLGTILLSIYFLAQKTKKVYTNLRIVFIFVYILYFIVTIYRIITFPDISNYFEYIILFILSYNIFKEIRDYWIFIVFNFLVITLLYYFSYIDQFVLIVLLYSFFLVAIINHVRYIVNLKAKDNFLFANNIVNKGTSLILGVNKLGEVVYCSENILNILGYTADEVKGYNFWHLTEDKEFKIESYAINESLYTRKLICKDKSHKYIQWKDSKYSEELYVSTGQDVTEQITLEYQYQKLIENATDIIFETDKYGNFTFINKHTQKVLSNESQTIIGKNFIDYIREDCREQVAKFYKEKIKTQDEIASVEFPILLANDKEIWISQNVTVLKDKNNTITGFSAIARDITLLKKMEQDEKGRQLKNEEYNKIINELVLKRYTKSDSFKQIIRQILKLAAEGSRINKISFWNYFDDKIERVCLYELNTNLFHENATIYKNEGQTYYKHISEGSTIIASNVFENEATKELSFSNILDDQTKSLLDVPVTVNGELVAILCFETTTHFRKWDSDDVNFSRSIADIIAINIESQKRFETEEKLASKTEILSAIATSTEKLLKKNEILAVFEEIFPIIGHATKVDRIYYFQNNATKQEMNQKYEWVNKNIVPHIDDAELLNLSNSKNEFILSKIKNNEVFNAIVNEIPDKILRERLQKKDVLSVLILPIFVKNEFYGTIGFNNCTVSRLWSEDEIGVLQILANNISSAIERVNNEKLINESEEKFKLLANNIPGTVYLSNDDEKWSKLYINDQIENLTGYSKNDFLENKVFLIDLVHEDEKEKVLAQNKKAVAEKQPFHLVYRIQKKSGEYIWVEEFGDTVSKDGQIQYLEGILFDITEKKVIETEIKARELAEASNKAKSDFLANMSHEIRTPLNAIVGFTDLLNETQLDKTQQEFVATVNQSADILLEVVNDILDFSKIETGKLNLEFQKIDLYEIVNQIIDIIRFDSEQKGIQLVLTIDESVPKFVSTDQLRLKQILLNLLSNAVKFTDKGKVELSIQLKSIHNETASILFKVIDSGIGIKKDNHKKIFEPFSQEDNSTTRKYGGTGLGLAISNNILKLMGSKLELESNYRKGSTFYFNLDLVFCKDESECNFKNINNFEVDFEDISHHVTKKWNENSTILIVEDNKINMMLVRTLLKKLAPYSIIIEAHNGKNGVEKCKEMKPNLVLLDIQMPILNGYEAAQEIRKFDTSVPIIALTAGTIKGEKEKCIQSGMNDYISKPIKKELFETILLKWLKK